MAPFTSVFRRLVGWPLEFTCQISIVTFAVVGVGTCLRGGISELGGFRPIIKEFILLEYCLFEI